MSRSEQEEEFDLAKEMADLPPLNIGALLMPAIWGPAHGIWLTILYYPIWLLADNLFYGAYTNPEPVSVVLSIVTALLLAGATVLFARVSQAYAFRRALGMGQSKETYRKRQVYWAFGMAVIAAIMIAAATYYNLVIRSTFGA